jgi:translocation and assembly module TamA
MTAFCAFPLHAQTPVNIEISGIGSTLEKNVRLFLSIEQQKNHPLITGGRLQRLHKKAPDEIASALQPFGFYRSSVNSSLVKADSGDWRASYSIDAGPAL